jgi:hypothetical protein
MNRLSLLFSFLEMCSIESRYEQYGDMLQVDELMRLAPELFIQKSKPDSGSTSSLSQPTPVAPKRLKVLNHSTV